MSWQETFNGSSNASAAAVAEVSPWFGIVADEDSAAGVLSTLASVYERSGYDAGYSRGVNDVLATVLEAAASFSRLQPGSANETFRLLHAFSEFLEQRVEGKSQMVDETFGDGSGI